jgi:hypothetical protein
MERGYPETKLSGTTTSIYKSKPQNIFYISANTVVPDPFWDSNSND